MCETALLCRIHPAAPRPRPPLLESKARLLLRLTAGHIANQNFDIASTRVHGDRNPSLTSRWQTSSVSYFVHLCFFSFFRVSSLFYDVFLFPDVDLFFSSFCCYFLHLCFFVSFFLCVFCVDFFKPFQTHCGVYHIVFGFCFSNVFFFFFSFLSCLLVFSFFFNLFGVLRKNGVEEEQEKRKRRRGEEERRGGEEEGRGGGTPLQEPLEKGRAAERTTRIRDSTRTKNWRTGNVANKKMGDLENGRTHRALEAQFIAHGVEAIKSESMCSSRCQTCISQISVNSNATHIS